MYVEDYILLTVTNDALFFIKKKRRGNDFGRDQNETAEREASVNLFGIDFCLSGEEEEEK